MKTSLKGRLEIAEHEGVVPAPYRDSVGVWTYGVGHTAAAGGLDPQEMNGAMPDDIEAAVDRALRLFADDLKSYERRVNDAIKVPLEQHQFDALVSWDFNTGGATWKHPRTGGPCQLIRQINAGDVSGDGFMGWLKPPEIRKRRELEQRLFRTGNYDHNGDQIPIWKTNGRGGLVGVYRTMSGAEVAERLNAQSGPKMRDTSVSAEGQGLWATIISIFRNLFGEGKA